jgi:putative phage-type endonuclease
MRTIHNIAQGSESWLKLRSSHFTASEASAAMGLSKYMSRTELLDQKHSGIAKDVDEHKQALFDRGHAAENSARCIAESILGSDLYPITATLQINGLNLLASVDGITMGDEEVIWEHKLYSESLAADVRAGTLAPHYTVQLDQQMLVCNTTKCLFMTSDGTEENMEYCWYELSQEKINNLIAAWQQFRSDLENYQPTQIAEKPMADAIADLPALFVQARGEITASNMEAFGESLKLSLANTRSIVLTTDQDYSNAEAAAKLYRETCKKLVLVKEAVLAQATTIGEATRMIDAWHEDLRVTALKLEKDVTEKKEAQKLAIITQARMEYIEHITALELEIKPIRLILPTPDFAAALKGKRLISAWHNAVNTLLAHSKALADAQAKDMREKLAWCKESSSGFGFLFNDLAQIITKPLDDFKLLVTSRIEAHKVAEVAKLELERERIRIEEEAKAKAKIEAEQQEEDARHVNIKMQEEKEAVEAEAKAKRIQDDLQRAKDEMAKRETEPVTASDPVIIPVRPEYPGESALLNCIMERYGVTKGEACDWILLAAENMRASA